MDFEEFYSNFKLDKYPFNVYTTEDEEWADRLFIEPTDYKLIKTAFTDKRTIIMSGNRGTGKTALLLDLKRKIIGNPIVCYITDFSSISMNPVLTEYYKCIISNLINSVVLESINKTKEISKLNKSDKVLLSYLVAHYTTPITKERLNDEIEKIQLSKYKRIIKKHLAFFRFVLNYGLTAAIKFFRNTFSINTSLLPDISDQEIKCILPDWNFDIEKEFENVDTSFSFLTKICRLLHKLKYDNIIIIIDRLDEDGRFANDAETISKFIQPLLTDSNLLLCKDMQLVISLWSIPFNLLKDNVRTQKYYCPELLWDNTDLLKAFSQRVKIYSSNKCNDFNSFFSDDVTDVIKEEILHMANHNPRDLWHILDNVFKAQFKIDAISNKLSLSAVEFGIENFVKKFNYYEYYPRKKGARSNSMDIYSYINYLLKLSTDDFTANQLNNEAKTGSSTQNYIIGMQKLGVVKRTDEKINNGVVYLIADPKISFAREKGINISHI